MLSSPNAVVCNTSDSLWEISIKNISGFWKMKKRPVNLAITSWRFHEGSFSKDI